MPLATPAAHPPGLGATPPRSTLTHSRSQSNTWPTLCVLTCGLVRFDLGFVFKVQQQDSTGHRLGVGSSANAEVGCSKGMSLGAGGVWKVKLSCRNKTKEV